MKPISFHVVKTSSEQHHHFHSKQAQRGTACEQKHFLGCIMFLKKKFTCTGSHLLHMLIKSSTQHQTKKNAKGKKNKVILLRQKKKKNRELSLEWKFMVFVFSFILSHWSLQLPWQEIILLLAVNFLLIINAAPLDTPTLSQEAQTQGTQTAA